MRSCFGAFVLLAALLPASVNGQTSSDFTFTVNGNGGLTLSNTLNQPPTTSCNIRVRGSIYYEGAESPLSIRTLLVKKIQKSQQFRMRVRHLPPVEKGENGARPVLSLQTRVWCPRTEVNVVSNAFARYVFCGEGEEATDAVSGRTFLIQLRKALRRQAGQPVG